MYELEESNKRFEHVNQQEIYNNKGHQIDGYCSTNQLGLQMSALMLCHNVVRLQISAWMLSDQWGTWDQTDARGSWVTSSEVIFSAVKLHLYLYS